MLRDDDVVGRSLVFRSLFVFGFRMASFFRLNGKIDTICMQMGVGSRHWHTYVERIEREWTVN